VKIVVFGLAVSSSWGNGHATLWRGLGKALGRAGGEIVFFERNQSFYAQARDATDFPGIRLIIYDDWAEVLPRALAEVRSAEVALVTSYCPDGPEAADLVRAHARLPAFYDMDTPVTLASLHATPAAYLPRDGLNGFDLVLSYTGGRALTQLASELGAGRVRPLFGSADTDLYTPAPAPVAPWAALGHLGTFADDRRAALDELFLEPARRLPRASFVLGGAQYPTDFQLPSNVQHLSHVPPGDHAAFYGAAALTLNITRATMAAMGFCPSGRLFEAAACGAAIISDSWDGLETFFTPGEEILIARSADDVLEALALGPAALGRIGRRARERVLAEHTAERRIEELFAILAEVGHERAESVGEAASA
jgi:spore maturation protein CgeB